ncbi:MAG: hypothetical protein HYU37_07365 [Acidobacteria bacterium]|nr:hypothetical protein [Acidobacteriota bacterium]
MTTTMDPPQSLIEKEIDTLYQQARRGETRGKRAAGIRRFAAYFLKIVAAGGSLFVATGYAPDWNQFVGVAILIAVLMDSVSSNHKRLLSEVQAGYAYEFLREGVSREFNRSLDPLLRRRQRAATSGEAPQQIEKEIEDLQQATHKRLADGVRQIRESLAAADLKALETLVLDNERAAAQQRGQ